MLNKIKALQNHLKIIRQIQIQNSIYQQLTRNPRYNNRINRYEKQVFSQGGEDGIISEIFNRVGTTNKTFVEFGVGDGLENNTAFLLMQGWKGFWLEYSDKNIENIHKNFRYIINKNLKVKQAFITTKNVESLFKKMNIPKAFDFLSIDIDGNDYWVWNAIKSYTPNVVCIEYNSIIPPNVSWTIKYDPKFIRKTENIYYGASLKALEKLGISKGYCLIGCNFHGVNTFFVRKDLIKDKFPKPYTAEHCYEPCRFHLLTKIGHKRVFGEYETP